jgi:hypothetical protein
VSMTGKIDRVEVITSVQRRRFGCTGSYVT